MSNQTLPSSGLDPQPTPTKNRRWLQWALLALGVVVLLGVGSAIGAGTKKTEAAAPVTTTVTVTQSAAAPITVTKEAAAVAPVTVTAPAPAALTVTGPAPPAVTVTAAPPAAAAPGGGETGPFVDGTYLIGTDIQAGNYKCSGATSDSRWIIEDVAGETMDIDFSAVARVPANGYTVQIKACPDQWEKVG